MRKLLFLLLLSPACKWTEFDDLKEEAWVNATKAPDNNSTNWGLAVQRGTDQGGGGRLAVLGTAVPVYNEISFDENGAASVANNERRLGLDGIAALEDPFFLADPESDAIAIIALPGVTQALVLEGRDGNLTPHNVFGPATLDAATFMVAPPIDGAVDPQPQQTLIGGGDLLLGTYYTPPSPAFQPKCRLFKNGPFPGEAVQIKALGAFRGPAGTSDTIVVWAGDGTLYIVPGGLFNGNRPVGGDCPDGTVVDDIGEFEVTAAPQIATGFNPDTGAQILTFGDGFAILQGHNDQNASFLQLVDLKTVPNPTLIGTPQAVPGLKQAAVYESGSNVAVIAGHPNDQVDGVRSGQVFVYDVDTTTGIAASPLEVLHDATPEDGQSYGRSVAVIELNGTPVIAVGGNNEVYTYFRTALLYTDDARANR